MASRQRDSDEEAELLPLKRFRKVKSQAQEEELLQKAVPISTRYKNNWAVNIFEEWRQSRENKVASLESTSMDVSLESIQNLDIEAWETMTVPSLNFWLGKFVEEAANKKGSPYPARTLYQLIASLKRHLESKNRNDVNMLDKSNMCFSGLRKILDAEMKSVHAEGVTNRKEEKEVITEEEEETMWRKGVLGQSTAKILLNTVYFYNGKLFGMRSQEHRQLRISDIEIEGDNTIIYRENSSKTFHGGIADLKKKARVIKHVCHEKGNESHERCLVKIYNRYFDLVNNLRVKAKGFYFQPYKDGKFAYKNCVVGIHTLNEILPSLCLAIGSKRKTSHSLRVTCVSKLFNASVDEKLIRSRSGHVSDALLAYEKSSKEQEQKVSNILNPPAQPKQVSSESKNEIKGSEIKNDIEMPVFDINELKSIFNDITGYEHEAQLNENTCSNFWSFSSDGPINISGNCNVTINQFKI